MKRILILGGGTAGWLAAAYLARTLALGCAGGVEITLVESEALGILGVGEGTFPTIRRTLQRIGISEADLVRRCSATFKQGSQFVGWKDGTAGDRYLHAFQGSDGSGPELSLYWLLGAAGALPWDVASTPQTLIANAGYGPKLPDHEDFVGPLNYAFHFDAVALAGLLREVAVEAGVKRVEGKLTDVQVGENGSIRAIKVGNETPMTADLFIDCSGFRAELIGKVLGSPWRSVQRHLFCDSAIALAVPDARPDLPIASFTLATAKDAGWIWDIGLATRRGIGHVYSSAHIDDDQAERALRDFAVTGADGEVRRFKFDAGYRPTGWVGNCVAIGLSAGFFEPLEATGIVFCEAAIGLVSNLFPWSGQMEPSARQFNRVMQQRYERALDFLKMHCCLSARIGDFWSDNRQVSSVPDSLLERLENWAHRSPNEMDVDANFAIFSEASWQFVLYGMGFRPDLAGQRATLRQFEAAQNAFALVKAQAAHGFRNLPSHRSLVSSAQQGRFGSERRVA